MKVLTPGIRQSVAHTFVGTHWFVLRNVTLQTSPFKQDFPLFMFLIGEHSQCSDKRGRSGKRAGAWKPLEKEKKKKLPSSSKMINAPRCIGKYAAVLN